MITLGENLIAIRLHFVLTTKTVFCLVDSKRSQRCHLPLLNQIVKYQ